MTNLEQALWWCNFKFLSRDLLDGQVLWIAQLSSSRAQAQAQLETKHASANSAGGEEAFQQKLSDWTSRQTLVDFWNLSDFILMGVFDNWLPSCLTYSLSLNLPISNSKQNIFWKTRARISCRRSRLKAWSFLLTPKRKLWRLRYLRLNSIPTTTTFQYSVFDYEECETYSLDIFHVFI